MEFAEDGRCLRLYTDKGRVKVPLTDSYFAEPLAKLFGGSVHGDELQVELCGVLKSGRTQLRVRVPTLAVCLSREHLARTTRWLPDETLIAIASENNLSETAFVVSYGKPYPYP